jgi:hypothetical protein
MKSVIESFPMVKIGKGSCGENENAGVFIPSQATVTSEENCDRIEFEKKKLMV